MYASAGARAHTHTHSLSHTKHLFIRVCNLVRQLSEELLIQSGVSLGPPTAVAKCIYTESVDLTGQLGCRVSAQTINTRATKHKKNAAREHDKSSNNDKEFVNVPSSSLTCNDAGWRMLSLPAAADASSARRFASPGAPDDTADTPVFASASPASAFKLGISCPSSMG